MSEPLRWGVLSTARINELVLAGARSSAQVEVLAVASRDGATAEGYAREHGIERAYGSYDALLADPEVEAVYISLPNALHVQWAIRALEAGKHVLCEKPLSRRSADAARAFDAAERCERLLMEAFMYRHNPQTARVVELVAEGAIGRLRLVRASFSFYLDDLTDVRMRGELDGGGLMDVGCYCVNAIRLLCSEPLCAQAEQLVGGAGVDVALAGVLSSRDELVVLGEQGSLHLADPWHCRTPGIELRRSGRSELIETPAANSYALELENLAAAIRGTAAPLLGR